jgi:hypothetical protein
MFAKSSLSICLHLVMTQTIAPNAASYLIELLFISDENLMSSLNVRLGSSAAPLADFSVMAALGRQQPFGQYGPKGPLTTHSCRSQFMGMLNAC